MVNYSYTAVFNFEKLTVGSTRGTKRQFNAALWISQGSLSEVVSGFDLIRTLYPNQTLDYENIYGKAEILAKKINKLSQ